MPLDPSTQSFHLCKDNWRYFTDCLDCLYFTIVSRVS